MSEERLLRIIAKACVVMAGTGVVERIKALDNRLSLVKSIAERQERNGWLHTLEELRKLERELDGE